MNESTNLNIVILGGNGYVGTALIKRWMKKEPNAEFFAISRSGKGKLNHSHVHYLKADVTKVHEVENAIPEKCDYIVDCVGIYTKDEKVLETYNIQPVKVMLQIANEKSIKALGYIGGIMGSKIFVESIANAIQMLKDSKYKVAYVEPTLIYGDGRDDSMTKMVPLLKFLGLFSKKMKPIEVNQVADELIERLYKLSMQADKKY